MKTPLKSAEELVEFIRCSKTETFDSAMECGRANLKLVNEIQQNAIQHGRELQEKETNTQALMDLDNQIKTLTKAVSNSMAHFDKGVLHGLRLAADLYTDLIGLLGQKYVSKDSINQLHDKLKSEFEQKGKKV